MKVRVGASILLAVALAAGAAGCSQVPETQRPYDPSEGVSAHVGDVKLLNMVIITEDGEDGNLLATAVNSGSDDVDLVLQFESGGQRTDLTVEVPAGSTVDLGYGGDGQLLLEGIDATAGTLFSMYVQYGSQPGRDVNVPVLDDALAHFEGLLPTPAPTPTPTPTPTAEPVPTPSPTP